MGGGPLPSKDPSALFSDDGGLAALAAASPETLGVRIVAERPLSGLLSGGGMLDDGDIRTSSGHSGLSCTMTDQMLFKSAPYLRLGLSIVVFVCSELALPALLVNSALLAVARSECDQERPVLPKGTALLLPEDWDGTVCTGTRRSRAGCSELSRCTSPSVSCVEVLERDCMIICSPGVWIGPAVCQAHP